MNLAHKFRSGKKELKEAFKGKKALFLPVIAVLLILSFIAGRKLVSLFVLKPSRPVAVKTSSVRPSDAKAVKKRFLAFNATSANTGYENKSSENKTALRPSLAGNFSNKTKEPVKPRESVRVSNQKLTAEVERHLALLEKELSEIDLVEKATEAFRTGNYAEAIRLYLKALKINPRNRKALLNLASIYLQVGKKKEAKRLFERLLRLEPRNIDALNNLGVMKMEEEKYREALSLFEKVLSIDPTNKAALINKAICLKRLGREDEAAKVYLYGMRLYPDEYRFYLYLGIYFYEKGQTDVAYKFLDQAYKLIPDKNSSLAAMLRRLLER